MQGEYFTFNQGPPIVSQGYGYGGFLPFGYGQQPQQQFSTQHVQQVGHKNSEKIKKNKKSLIDGKRYEDVTNSTDESIHLVRSRKTGGKLLILE